jgi:hypothetical protein
MPEEEDEAADEDDFDKEFENIVKKQKEREQAAITSKAKAVISIKSSNVRSSSTNQVSGIQLPVMAPSKLSGGKGPTTLGTSSPPHKSVASKAPNLQYHQRVVEERNPYKFIEKTLVEARQRLDKMKDTPKLLETIPDNQKKKKYLKAENKQLRDQLKKMSENVNQLIDKMNQEALKKKKLAGNHPAEGERPGSQKIRTRQKEIENTDKAIRNLIKEHHRVKKRLEEVQSPDFLLNLKMGIKTAEKEIKDYEKLLQQLHVE